MTQTQFYKLNSWAAEDRILRTDFNADNAKLDTALHTLDGKTAALEGKIAAERTYCNDKIAGERTHTDSGLSAVNNSITSHSHWKKLHEITLGSSQTSMGFDLPAIDWSKCQLLRMDIAIKGYGRFWMRPNGSDQCSYQSIGGGTGTPGGVGAYSNSDTWSAFLPVGGDGSKRVTALSLGNVLQAGTAHTQTYTGLTSFTFFPDSDSFNYHMDAGTRISLWSCN